MKNLGTDLRSGFGRVRRPGHSFSAMLRRVLVMQALFVALIAPGSAMARPNWVKAIDWTRFTRGKPSTPVPGQPLDHGAAQIEALLAKASKWSVNGFYANYDDTADYLDITPNTSCPVRDNTCWELQVRLPASVAFSLAVALKMGAYDASITGVSASVAKDRAIKLAKSVAKTHFANAGRGHWGNNWQSAAWAFYNALGAWLLWDDLSDLDRLYVEKMLEFECNNIKDKAVPVMVNKDGVTLTKLDSKFEENQWNANALQTCLGMMPNHPQWRYWMDQMLEYQISATARETDMWNNAVVHGRKISLWTRGYNVNADGGISNHNRKPNAVYTSFVAIGAVPFRLAGLAAPQAVNRNLERLYEALTDPTFNPTETWNRVPLGASPIYVDSADFQSSIAYPGGSEWGNLLYTFIATDSSAVVFGLDNLSQRKPSPALCSPGSTLISGTARCWEYVHARSLRNMQDRFTDGSSLATGESTHNARIEPDVVFLYAEAHLLRWLRHQSDQWPAFDSASYLPPPAPLRAGSHNDDSIELALVGDGWQRWNSRVYFNGDISDNMTPNSEMRFTLGSGMHAGVYGAVRPDGGHAAVYLDDVHVKNLDFFRPGEDQQKQVLLFDTRDLNLTSGQHTLRIVVKGTRTPGSSGNFVFIDEVLVSGVLTAGTYDDRHPYLSYGRDHFLEDRFDDAQNAYPVYGLVDWATWPHPSNHSQSLQFSSSTGYYVEFTYTGSVAKVYGLRSIGGGIGTVSIDGIVVGEIDFFSGTGDQFQQQVYSTAGVVAAGTHRVRISVAGDNNGSSRGAANAIYIDKVVVQ